MTSVPDTIKVTKLSREEIDLAQLGSQFKIIKENRKGSGKKAVSRSLERIYPVYKDDVQGGEATGNKGANN